MRLNAPRKGIWIFSFILALASLVSHFTSISGMSSEVTYWVMSGAWLLLLLSTYFKKM